MLYFVPSHYVDHNGAEEQVYANISSYGSVVDIRSLFAPLRSDFNLVLPRKSGANMLRKIFGQSGYISSTPNKPVRSWVVLGLTSLCVTTAAFAPGEAVAQCSGTDKVTATQFRVSQQSGRALVVLSRPHSVGRKVEIDYGDELYVGEFDQDGRARMGFVLTEPRAEFAIRIAGSPAVTCAVEVPDFNKIGYH